MANVFAAFFSLGILKNGTALLIASTPVSELDPLENARKISASGLCFEDYIAQLHTLAG